MDRSGRGALQHPLHIARASRVWCELPIVVLGESRCSGSAIFNAVAASPWPRTAVGPEEGDGE
jgi:hypothetical protein